MSGVELLVEKLEAFRSPGLPSFLWRVGCRDDYCKKMMIGKIAVTEIIIKEVIGLRFQG